MTLSLHYRAEVDQRIVFSICIYILNAIHLKTTMVQQWKDSKRRSDVIAAMPVKNSSSLMRLGCLDEWGEQTRNLEYPIAISFQ